MILMTMTTNPKIFLVEDDPFCNALYEQHLLNLGYKSISAFSSGSELLKNLYKKPELIFLDYNLQDYKGLLLLKKIKEFNPNIYVVVISGQSDMETTVNLLKHGAFDYIVKDENETGKISACIEKWLAAKAFSENMSKHNSKLSQEQQLNIIIEAQEKVRKEISTELHDNVNQLLGASQLYIDTAYKNESSRLPFLLEAKTIINSAIGEVRKLSHNLQSVNKEEQNLEEEVSKIVAMLKGSNKFIVISEIDIDGINEILPQNAQHNIIRIIQELTNNMLKYSNAKMIFIGLSFSNQELHLTFSDDGVGFDIEKAKKGLGITNILNRLSLINGIYFIDTDINKGCSWNIRVPLAKSMKTPIAKAV